MCCIRRTVRASQDNVDFSGGSKHEYLVLLEGDDEISISLGAEWVAIAAANALGPAAVDLVWATYKGHAFVLERGGHVFHDANRGITALLVGDGLVEVVGREIDDEPLLSSFAQCVLVEAIREVVGIGPGCLEVTDSCGELPEECPSNSASVMPQIATDVVAEESPWR